LGDIKLVAKANALLKYAPDKSIFYCPNTPMAMRKKAWSSYQLDFLMVSPNGDPVIGRYLNWFHKQLTTMGSRTPLAICNIHDETYYAPREENIDPDLAKPFQLHLDVDGSVEATRFNGKRYTTIISN
jgi:hypothetical protein